MRQTAALTYQVSQVGCPIRKSSDQRVFAPPRRLSQRITSFIACACQGIHQLPLRHLIILIANAHHFSWRTIPVRKVLQLSGVVRGSPVLHQEDRQTMRLAEKTSFSRSVRWRGQATNHVPGIERPTATNHTVSRVELEQIFSSRCQTKQAKDRSLPQTFAASDHRSHGGAGRDRTDDILLAKQALSQLSYGPNVVSPKATTTNDATGGLPSKAPRAFRHPKTQSAALDVGLRPRLPRRRRRLRSAALSWWAWEDLNLRPHAYQARALTN